MRASEIAVGVYICNVAAPMEAWHVETGARRAIPASSTWRVVAYEDGQVCVITTANGASFDTWIDAADLAADFDVTKVTEH